MRFNTKLHWVSSFAGVGIAVFVLFSRAFWNYFLFLYPYIFLVLCTLFLFSVSAAIVKYRNDRIQLAFFALLLAAVVGSFIFDLEWLRSETVLRASYKDDLNLYSLSLRVDGSCYILWTGLFGVSEEYTGRYCRTDNKIILQMEDDWAYSTFADTLLVKDQTLVPVSNSPTNQAGVFVIVESN